MSYECALMMSELSSGQDKTDYCSKTSTGYEVKQKTTKTFIY